MKTIFIKIGMTILLSLGFMVIWMIGFGVSQALFQVKFPRTEASESTMLGSLLLIAGLEASVLYWANHYVRAGSGKRFWINFLLLFGVQFFMSQNEGWFFQDAVGMSNLGIAQTLFGGLMLSAGFSALLVIGTRKVWGSIPEKSLPLNLNWKVVVLALLVYPLIYILAGHFIAWQFPAVRQYYTGGTLNAGFVGMFKAYFRDGLYFFQVIRGVFWVLIAWPFLKYLQAGRVKAGLILGVVFSVLHCVQLLIPNPYMPVEVRYPHLVETGISVFVWGFVLAWWVGKAPKVQM